MTPLPPITCTGSTDIEVSCGGGMSWSVVAMSDAPASGSAIVLEVPSVVCGVVLLRAVLAPARLALMRTMVPAVIVPTATANVARSLPTRNLHQAGRHPAIR